LFRSISLLKAKVQFVGEIFICVDYRIDRLYRLICGDTMEYVGGDGVIIGAKNSSNSR
jgi:hypothetical protein